MHYFLRLEVWECPEGIFLNQWKYAIEILKIIDMLDCKAMATNLKFLSDKSSKLVDMTQYRQIIQAIYVFDKYKGRYMLCCE